MQLLHPGCNNYGVPPVAAFGAVPEFSRNLPVLCVIAAQGRKPSAFGTLIAIPAVITQHRPAG
jgi:hypothetical protein